jgi:glutathione S-transferase
MIPTRGAFACVHSLRFFGKTDGRFGHSIMIHFYHHPLSPYSRKVFFLLEESRLAYDLQVVSLERREQRTTEYLAVNPSGRVPAIRDGEFSLGESNAILRYLVRRFRLDQFYPVGLQEQALVDMWWEFCSVHINRPLIDLAWNRIMVKKFGGQPDFGVIAKAEKNIARDLPVLERHLLGRNFMFGHELSIADMNLMPFASYARDVLPMREFPMFDAWISRVGSRSSWKTVSTYSGG